MKIEIKACAECPGAGICTAEVKYNSQNCKAFKIQLENMFNKCPKPEPEKAPEPETKAGQIDGGRCENLTGIPADKINRNNFASAIACSVEDGVEMDKLPNGTFRPFVRVSDTFKVRIQTILNPLLRNLASELMYELNKHLDQAVVASDSGRKIYGYENEYHKISNEGKAAGLRTAIIQVERFINSLV